MSSMISKVLMKVLHRTKLRVFINWKSSAKRLAIQRILVKRSLAKLARKNLAQCTQRWREKASEARRNRILVLRFRIRIQKNTLLRTFKSLHTFCGARQVARVKMARLASKWRFIKLRTAFQIVARAGRSFGVARRLAFHPKYL